MFQNVVHGVKPIKIVGLHLKFKTILPAVCVANMSVTWSYQTGFQKNGVRSSTFSPTFQLGNPTEECRKIGRLSAFISAPRPT